MEAVGNSEPLHLIGDLPQHVLFLEMENKAMAAMTNTFTYLYHPFPFLHTPLSSKDSKSAKHTRAKWQHQRRTININIRQVNDPPGQP